MEIIFVAVERFRDIYTLCNEDSVQLEKGCLWGLWLISGFNTYDLQYIVFKYIMNAINECSFGVLATLMKYKNGTLKKNPTSFNS